MNNDLNFDTLISWSNHYHYPCIDTDTDVMYRYIDGYNEYGHGEIELTVYKVVKHTPCGVKILLYGKERFISNTSGKRFAYVDKKAALVGYIYRKKYQLRVLESKIRMVTECLSSAEQKLNE